jgi:predicted phage terminase large subunit-like protein
MVEAAKVIELRPQPGPQELFFSTTADIAIYGGAAFAGKTFALQLEPCRHLQVKDFTAVFFRRTTTQVTNPGGLWDEGMKLYPLLGLEPVAGRLEFRRRDGTTFIKMGHLQYDETVYDWDGAQVPLFCFDQLEHFSRFQFFYMLSRNRSMCGVQPYIRATCNPNADSWLAEFLEWWIDQETGFPIKERAGVIRWFTRDSDRVVWAATREELVERYGEESKPRSLTFIPGNIYDNKIGMARDPNYIGNLRAMQRVERERLLGGNWKIRPAAGLMFQRIWCKVIDTAPDDTDWVRYWDLAATRKEENNDPDWTVGIKLGRVRSTRRYILANAIRMQESPGKVESAIHNTASADGHEVRVGLPQDPGQAGKAQAEGFVKDLAGFAASAKRESGDKVVRFSPFSAQCEAGNVDILRGFSEDSLASLEAFPDAAHDDDADACSGAFSMFTQGVNIALWERLANG